VRGRPGYESPGARLAGAGRGSAGGGAGADGRTGGSQSSLRSTTREIRSPTESTMLRPGSNSLITASTRRRLASWEDVKGAIAASLVSLERPRARDRLDAVQVREVMTESVVTAPSSAAVREVAELMRERNVGSVVLVDGGGSPAGFITDRDLAVSVLADARDPAEQAGDHASAPVVTGAPEMHVEQAAELMVSHGIRRLPVLDGERLTGIVTLDDLAVRTGDLELAHRLTGEITRAALPDFYFHQRGG